MPKTPKNIDAVGIALVLLLATKRTGKLGSGRLGPGRLAPIGQAIDFGLFTHNLHRMVDMVDQIDGLTQLTHRTPLLNSSSSDYGYDQGYGRSNENDYDYNYNYDQDQNTGSENFIPDSFNLPDMGQLMEMAGPLLSLFGGRK